MRKFEERLRRFEESRLGSLMLSAGVICIFSMFYSWGYCNLTVTAVGVYCGIGWGLTDYVSGRRTEELRRKGGN